MLVVRLHQHSKNDNPSKANFHFNDIPIKLPTGYFISLDKILTKFSGKKQKISNINGNDKKKYEGGMAHLDFKVYYKAAVLKTTWYWLNNNKKQRHRSMEQ